MSKRRIITDEQLDWIIATVVFMVAIIAGIFQPWLAVLTAPACINLCWQRYVAWNAGAPFETRVRAVVWDELQDMDRRLVAMEANVTDVKEAQIRIAGQFRGKAMHQ